MAKAKEEKFDELHNLVTNEFLKRVRSGEATTQDLKAACDWLKTNDITGVASVSYTHLTLPTSDLV